MNGSLPIYVFLPCTFLAPSNIVLFFSEIRESSPQDLEHTGCMLAEE